MWGVVVLGILTVGSALGVVAARHPVHSALFLVLNSLSLALFYFGLRAEFMGVAQVIVYTGAVMVLFLFVVTLLSAGRTVADLPEELGWQRPLAGVLAAGTAAALGAAALAPVLGAGRPPRPGFGGLTAVAASLWGPFFPALLGVAVMLLTAVLGVLVLNRSGTAGREAGSGEAPAPQEAAATRGDQP
ncbi:NADH-quinone oxidoreductase subunit J [Candidatus Hydrogenisulfobacillus filiaventi]|uniref:NADH-quinone oxidoreductase subunit J n=1 Tax=Candidatus Hydrogenisulfobacillus filiaventi TaxID=2707344 RepID=A0A6F8ZHU4_9FIRM|nr:NADH-quinone oxidoreductase subunit J [Bacillota bacterium]CAB1129334.1 NADH-quinone oxidoreductase subunit J [Candidatus Hydrogenisulfobacillus filiaventi]